MLIERRERCRIGVGRNSEPGGTAWGRAGLGLGLMPHLADRKRHPCPVL